MRVVKWSILSDTRSSIRVIKGNAPFRLPMYIDLATKVLDERFIII